MKKLKLTIVILALAGLTSFQSIAQKQQGIHFEKGLSWQQVLEKAKTEHKYIFVDCYATWCGPCKFMDNQVYNQPEVGDAYNRDFVSVKVQMDKKPIDDAQIKNWYGTVDTLAHTYGIDGYPTFLFFDPNGNLVDKITGALDAKDFIPLASDVRNPLKQNYNLRHHFEPGKLDTVEERGLVTLLKTTDHALAGRIAGDYLSRIPEDRLNESQNIYLIIEFQDNPEVLNVAIGYLQKKLDQKTLLTREGILPNIAQQKKVQQVVTGYLARYKKEEFFKPAQLKFTIDILYIPGVRKIAADYIKKLSHKEISIKTNLEFISQCRGDSDVQKIAKKYIQSLSENAIYTKPMLNFIAFFTQTPADKGFGIFYHNTAKVNSVIGRNDFARNQVVYSILKATDDTLFAANRKNGTTPYWKKLHREIDREYGSAYSEMVTSYSQVNWYSYLLKKGQSQFMPQWIAAYVEKVQSMRDDTVAGNDYHLNDIAMAFFRNSNDQKQLKIACGWMKEIAGRNPAKVGWLDTYALLLYKSGQVQEAVSVEENNLHIQIARDKSQGQPALEFDNKTMVQYLATTVEKMKRTEAIWTEEGYK